MWQMCSLGVGCVLWASDAAVFSGLPNNDCVLWASEAAVRLACPRGTPEILGRTVPVRIDARRGTDPSRNTNLKARPSEGDTSQQYKGSTITLETLTALETGGWAPSGL